jgi:hypothetical protein
MAPQAAFRPGIGAPRLIGFGARSWTSLPKPAQKSAGLTPVPHCALVDEMVEPAIDLQRAV